MTQQLLDRSQIRPTVEQMCGRGVPQRMRTARRSRAQSSQVLVQRAAHYTDVDPPPAPAQEAGRA